MSEPVTARQREARAHLDRLRTALAEASEARAVVAPDAMAVELVAALVAALADIADAIREGHIDS